ncbi:porimin [Fukomys damarensis]|uniref:porimin n=1 Tax=Fukomys damarensis TaxID=885580 RepID=UPI001455D295|nr:porimin [Fukomys damarensis]
MFFPNRISLFFYIEYTVPLHNSSGNLSETVPSSNTSKSSNTSSSTVKPLTTISVVSINVTAVTRKSTSKMATPGVSTSTTPTTSKSTPKGTSISHNISHMSTPTMTTTHSSSVTLLTTTVHSKEYRGSKFDTGSFVGGIVLTLGVLSILYIGCKMYYSRRGIRYRTIDEHDAII